MSRTVDFYWDMGSTNTCFAFKRLPGVLERTGADVRYHPLNPGYVFRHYNYVLTEEPSEKRRYRRRDLERRAEYYNPPFRMPDKFPIKTSRALRGSLAMRRLGCKYDYLDRIFSAYWEGNLIVEDYDVIAPLMEALGSDPDEFIRLADSNGLRAEPVDMTNAALEKGVFGALTFMVGDEMFAGKDRSDYLEGELDK